jgi:hypothetical protein
MDWIEIIELHAYRWPETQRAITAFKGITGANREEGLTDIHLFQSLAIENDLSIFITWQGSAPSGGRSRLGVQLAAAFAEFGQIHHCGWQHQENLNTRNWSHRHADTSHA